MLPRPGEGVGGAVPLLRRAGRVVSVTDREHLSIGEVLSLLQAEFPDVTISKIRFLESQGLIDPERTPSGYRKFYDADVARLRWILVQQRDHFLPLKVIKDRLEGGAVELPFDPPLPGDAPPEAGVDGVASPSGPAASGTGADGDPAGRKVAPGDGGDGPARPPPSALPGRPSAPPPATTRPGPAGPMVAVVMVAAAMAARAGRGCAAGCRSCARRRVGRPRARCRCSSAGPGTGVQRVHRLSDPPATVGRAARPPRR
ncbi:MAG: MerR family DNA-binding transcriptional regulator [Acidimicrobiales bacterium]